MPGPNYKNSKPGKVKRQPVKKKSKAEKKSQRAGMGTLATVFTDRHPKKLDACMYDYESSSTFISWQNALYAVLCKEYASLVLVGAWHVSNILYSYS